MSRGLILSFLVCLGAALLPAAAEPPGSPKTATGDEPLRTQAEVVQPFMRAKLEHAQHAATVAYLDLTVKGVQCHRYLRGRSVSSVPAPGK
jgi:hypothetical protein